MKRISRKITAVFLSMMLTVLSVVVFTPLTVFADTLETPNYTTRVSNVNEIVTRLNALRNKYENTYWTTNGQASDSNGSTSKYFYGWQCNGFGKYIFNDLFLGGNIGKLSSEKYYMINVVNMTLIEKTGSVDEATAKRILSCGHIGDLIQTRRRKSGNPHTMILFGLDGTGVRVFDCNADGDCKVQCTYQTWSDFSEKNTGMSLYHSNYYPSSGGEDNPIPDPPPAQNVTLTKDNNFPTPITAYPIATSGKITVYSDTDLSAYPVNKRYIAYNDECTITAVYTNGYCRVRYPSGSKTAEALARNTSFFNGSVSPYAWTATAEIKSYIRSDMRTQYGSVSKNDACTVVGKSGNNVQVIYPITGGYKLGWINPSSASVPTPTPTPTPTPSVTLTQDGRYPTPITAYPLATSGKITVYANDLSAYPIGTRNIAFNDRCTITAVYTNGYCSVTYPTSSGSATALAQTSSFIVGNTGPGSWTASQKYNSYVRSDMGTQFGSVSSGDVCIVVGQSGNNSQVIYPVSGGYKLGWINTSNPDITPAPAPDPVVTPATPVTSDDHGLNGAVDAVEGGSDYVHVRGWAFDSDDMEYNVFIHVYIGGIAGSPEAEAVAIRAENGGRSDVDNQYHCGDHHAYYANVTTSKRGTQPVYVYAIDCRDNSVSKCIGWGTVEIGGNGSGGSNNPIGLFEEVTAGEGYVYVRGWAFDRDNCDHSIFVHIYIGGVVGDENAEGHAIIANVHRQDVDNAHHCGVYHGFSAKIKTNKRGVQEIHAYAINIDGGTESPCIGDKTTGNITSESEPPQILESYISDLTADGYRINIKATDNVGIDKISIATWSNPNQSDLKWTDAVDRGDGTYYLDRKRSDFELNETGYYHNHAYVQDYSGNQVVTCPNVDYKITSDTGENVKAGKYRLVSALNPERAIDISAGSTDNNANVQLWANLQESQQTFNLEYMNNGFYRIINTNSDKALDSFGNGYQPKTNVHQYKRNNHANQEWMFVEVLDGYYAIVSRYNGLALTVEDGVDANGTNICVDTLTYSDSQLWKLRRVIDDSMVAVEDITIYESNPLAPSVIVTSGEERLVENDNYTMNFSVDGTVGTVTIIGIDNYCDSVTKTFNITYLEDPTIPGDTNGDGKVNMKDIVLLQQYLNDWDVEIDLDASDVNDDEKVNMKDIVLLQQYLNDWDVVLK